MASADPHAPVMEAFLDQWGRAALTSVSFFWMALWAFALGYLVSSMIQVFVTRQRMRRSMGVAGPRAVALGAFFGFISSSCSFAALSTTRALLQKGAGLAPALAFLLASTNLVIELGILIYIFLGWEFVVGEYVGGIILILVMWLLVALLVPQSLIDRAREHAQRVAAEPSDEQTPDWRKLIHSREGWRRVSQRYFMEWAMVWKDVTFGFTVAGVIAVFVPADVFQTMFLGSGDAEGPATWQIMLHTLIGPAAAFFTFIGSMGNIPLAGVLFASGVSFAGIMAFIFSDLVVFPVLRISTHYFGLRMAMTILAIFLVCLVIASLTLHYGMDLLGLLPEDPSGAPATKQPTERFGLDYTFWLNLAFLAMTAGLAWLARAMWKRSEGDGEADHHDHGGSGWGARLSTMVVTASILWLVVGLGIWSFA